MSSERNFATCHSIPYGANRHSVPLTPSARVLANIGDFLREEAVNKRRVVVFSNGAAALTHVSEHVQRTIVALNVTHAGSLRHKFGETASRNCLSAEANVLFATYGESSTGIDLSTYDTILFLGLPFSVADLIQAGARISRTHRPDDHSFKKWVLGWDGSFGGEDRLVGIQWAQYHLSEFFDENRVSALDLNSEPNYVAPSGDQLR